MKKLLCALALLVCLCGSLASAAEWYDGGTLHEATIREWKEATPENKLATCSDFVVALWKSGNLKLPISDIDSVKPYAIELRTFIDTATDGIDDADHYTVKETAIMGVVMMGWGKN